MGEGCTTWRVNDSGRWEIYGGIDTARHEVRSGNVIFVEVEGHDELKPTRIEFAYDDGGGWRYVSVDGYPLWDGMRAETRWK
jgi:hypothetical protein